MQNWVLGQSYTIFKIERLADKKLRGTRIVI